MFKIFRLPDLRKRILFTLLMIVVYRFLAHVPVPGVDISAIKAYISSNALLGLFDYFSGGGFQNFSIVTLGLSPYINASIVIQLMTVMIPSLEELSKEGETGREKINQYTKYLTVPLAFFQGYSVYFLLSRQGVIGHLEGLNLLVLIATLLGGAMLAVWIGDLLTEHGIGNGISFLIFIGIISRVPTSALQFILNFNSSMLPQALAFLVIALIVIVGVVLVNEGTRNIALEYGRRGFSGQKASNYLPIKVNQAGVMPIIFAISVVSLPLMVSPVMQASGVPVIQNLGIWLAKNLTDTSLARNLIYFTLVFAFTYFYTMVQFDPNKISEDIKKRGGFIPGVRPGSATTSYLKKVINRITLAGGLFLGLVAIMPFLVSLAIGGGGLYSIGGTGLLIAVSVVLDSLRQIESMLVMRNYDSFLS